jgi:hypothetical protein
MVWTQPNSSGQKAEIICLPRLLLFASSLESNNAILHAGLALYLGTCILFLEDNNPVLE